MAHELSLEIAEIPKPDGFASTFDGNISRREQELRRADAALNDPSRDRMAGRTADGRRKVTRRVPYSLRHIAQTYCLGEVKLDEVSNLFYNRLHVPILVGSGRSDHKYIVDADFHCR